MNLFNKFSYNPYKSDANLFLDEIVDYNDYIAIHNDLKPLVSDFNKKIYMRFFKGRFNFLETEFKLIHPRKIFFNLLIRSIILQKILNKYNNEKIVIECFDQELNFYNDGSQGFSINHFANQYAWLAKKIGHPFIVKSKGKIKNYKKKSILSKNQFLRVINYNFSLIFFLIKSKVFKQNQKRKIITLKDNNIIKEIKFELSKKNIGFLSIETDLKKIFYKKTTSINKIDYKYYEYVFKELKSSLKSIMLKYNLDKIVFNSYLEILSEITALTINHLINIQSEMRKKIKDFKKKISHNICISNGLFGAYGLSVCDSLIENKLKIFTAEHGLTAGISIDPTECSDENESKTSHVIFCYNESSKKVHDKYENTNAKTVVVGAPSVSKKIEFRNLQRLYNRKRFKPKTNRVVFYVSHNLQLNANKYFPFTKPNSEIFKDEIFLLKKLGKINKEVFFKLYYNEHYIVGKDSEINKIAGKYQNLNYLNISEDFRYTRTLADIIITQASESTLEWCIGLNVPLIFLDSNYYEPLENEKVKKAFKESFFVFNYDNLGWEKNLIDFLNLPYSKIISLWNTKAKYREKYDEYFFLSKKKYAGKIGSEYIIDFIKNKDIKFRK